MVDEIKIIDAIMFLKFLFHYKTKSILKYQLKTNYKDGWNKLSNVLVSKLIPETDQKNLAILAKTMSDCDSDEIQIWEAINKRFFEISTDFDLNNYSFMILAFQKKNLLDHEKFYEMTRKILLLNSNNLTWRDVSTISSVHKYFT